VGSVTGQLGGLTAPGRLTMMARMPVPDPDPRPPGPSRRGRLPTLLLAAAASLAVLYAGLCKALLFHDLEYVGSDFFSFLEMSWSWYYAGLLLHDNVYGYHFAIHNFYLLLAFSPLTIPLGAYGLILGLVLLNLVPVLRVAHCARLDVPRRLGLLAGALCPVAYFVFDHPSWGFHPELCYPPLALLLALELIDGRTVRAVLVALLIVLVKEDGAVLCATILLAYFAGRLWMLRAGPREERRRVAAAALLSLLAATVAFIAGMALLSTVSRAFASTQATSPERVMGSLRKVAVILTGEGRPFLREQVATALVVYALIGILVLLPLGRRLPRGLLLFLLSSPPLVAILVVSSGIYSFNFMLWPPRLATLLALVVACLAFASIADSTAPAESRPLPSTLGVGLLVVFSWGLQILLLARLGYSPWPRVRALQLLSGRDYPIAAVPKAELRFLRCLAAHLPGGLPISSVGDTHPVFHRQSIVFRKYPMHAWHPPRLRVIHASDVAPAREGALCLGPRAGTLVVEAECDLIPLVAGCGSAPEPEAGTESRGGPQ
jgi:hypothetical protein